MNGKFIFKIKYVYNILYWCYDMQALIHPSEIHCYATRPPSKTRISIISKTDRSISTNSTSDFYDRTRDVPSIWLYWLCIGCIGRCLATGLKHRAIEQKKTMWMSQLHQVVWFATFLRRICYFRYVIK